MTINMGHTVLNRAVWKHRTFCITKLVFCVRGYGCVFEVLITYL
jgi:hypothetical protein